MRPMSRKQIRKTLDALPPEALDTLNHQLCACSPAHWAATRLGVDMDGWQEDFVDDPRPSVMAVTSRQVGKTMSVGIKAAHMATFRPGSTVVLTAASERQAQELFRYTNDNLHKAGLPRVRGDNLKTRMTLANGSRVIALPNSPDTVRGIPAADLVVIDEAAYAGDGLLVALSPMLAVNAGQLIMTSTPAGQAGSFWNAYQHALTDTTNWGLHIVKATDCPRIEQNFLDREKARLGSTAFATEYMAEFRADHGSPFTAAMVDACVDPSVGATDALLDLYNLT